VASGLLTPPDNFVKGSVSKMSDVLADEILRYLVEHPEAQDTIEGVVDWWLTERRVRQGIAEVDAALQLLVDKGLVRVVRARDGKKHYSLKRKKKINIRKRPNAPK
jgi:Fe2+ or Zn2+ uptake regulation protein